MMVMMIGKDEKCDSLFADVFHNDGLLRGMESTLKLKLLFQVNGAFHKSACTAKVSNFTQILMPEEVLLLSFDHSTRI